MEQFGSASVRSQLTCPNPNQLLNCPFKDSSR